MTQPKQPLADVFAARNFLKIIAGIDNFDVAQALAMAQAAAAGGAQAVDVAADAAIIQAVRERFPDLHVFASALDAAKLAAAARAGAHVVELGNFDAIYKTGGIVTGPQAVEWTRLARQAVPADVPLCATVPGCLAWDEQIQVAAQLQAAGADILQLEGCHDTALAVATAVAQAVQVPVFVSGGVEPKHVAAIRATGVHGLGVGHFVRKAGDQDAMNAATRVFAQALAAAPAASSAS